MDEINQTSQTNFPQPPITSVPPTNNIKITLTLIFILILLVSAVILGIQIGKSQQISNSVITPTQVVSPTINPTQSLTIENDFSRDWKTYISTNQEYSLKYPSDYFQSEPNENQLLLNSPLNSNRSDNEINMQNGELKIVINISDADLNQTLNDFVKKKTEEGKSLYDLKIFEEKEILIDGIKAIMQTWETQEYGKNQTIYLLKNNKEIVIIKYPYETSRNFEFDQILSTLKF